MLKIFNLQMPVADWRSNLTGGFISLFLSPKRSAVALCNLKRFNYELPSIYQNFDKIPDVNGSELGMYGGSVSLADYCPYKQVGRSAGFRNLRVSNQSWPSLIIQVIHLKTSKIVFAHTGIHLEVQRRDYSRKPVPISGEQ